MPSIITMLWIAAATAAAIAVALILARHRVDEPVAPGPTLAAPPLPERYRCQRRRVLVVTPRALIGDQIARMLQGSDVAIATGPEAALTAISRDPGIDAILYTLAMPGLSGFALAEQHPELRPCLVFMVGHAGPEDLGENLAAADVPWIELPPSYAELATAVDVAAHASREDLRLHDRATA